MIRDLLNRPPHVCVNGHMSEEIVLNSGVPFHPCSFLYTQITLGFKIPELFKFADDLALVGL